MLPSEEVDLNFLLYVIAAAHTPQKCTGDPTRANNIAVNLTATLAEDHNEVFTSRGAAGVWLSSSKRIPQDTAPVSA